MICCIFTTYINVLLSYKQDDLFVLGSALRSLERLFIRSYCFATMRLAILSTYRHARIRTLRHRRADVPNKYTCSDLQGLGCNTKHIHLRDAWHVNQRFKYARSGFFLMSTDGNCRKSFVIHPGIRGCTLSLPKTRRGQVVARGERGLQITVWNSLVSSSCM